MLTILRYNTFLVLYPIGLFSEAALVYLSVTQATDISQFYRGYLLLGLIAYIPRKHETHGSPMLQMIT